ncbi:hypothetical protein L1987_20771 [Smallanthus sonchifolius]|uniref:Uncharacterized protein n=1 Tax=Smallanthus sonchifolius TaxID=185202 RepID=A0ACB9IUJ1_9ASTR|nr:hypothetical protein L1987_20771 [Smallanthus sonchifolius]
MPIDAQLEALQRGRLSAQIVELQSGTYPMISETQIFVWRKSVEHGIVQAESGGFEQRWWSDLGFDDLSDGVER